MPERARGVSHLGTLEEDMGAGCTGDEPGAKIPDMTPTERKAYAMGYAAACDAMKDIYATLGWQGGTIHQVVQEVRQLRENEATLRGALIAAVKAAQGFREALPPKDPAKAEHLALNTARRHLATAVAVGVRYLDARRGLVTPALLQQLPEPIRALWQDGQDRRITPVPSPAP